MILGIGRRLLASAESWLGRWIWAIPLLLVVTGFSARQLDLIVPEVDEFYFMNDVGLVSAGPYSPFAVLESVARNSPNHAPLYFILLNLWSGLVGGEIAILRVLTLFTGLLSLAMIYRLARDFVAPLAGLLALVVALSNALYNFYYANARMYPLLVLTGAITLWLYLRLAQSDRPAKRGDYLALAAACYALANTHVFSALLFVALGLHHLLHAPKDGRWLKLSLAVLAGLLLFSPWLGVLLTQGLERTYATWRAESDSLGETLSALHAVAFNGSAALSLLTVAGLALGWRRRTIDLAAPTLILLYFLIAFSLVALLSEAFGVSKVRFGLAGWPALLLIIAGALYSLYRWRRWLLLVALLFPLAGLSFQQSADWTALFLGRERPYSQPAWHIVSRLARQSRPAAPILTWQVDLTDIHWPAYINYPQSRYYFADRGLTLLTPSDTAAFKRAVFDYSIGAPFLRVFYQESRVAARDRAELDAIMQVANYQVCDERRFGVDTVFVTYGWQAANCEAPTLLARHSSALIDYEFFGAGLNAAGDAALFIDRWRARSEIAADGYSLSHQLLDADWERVAQLDLPLLREGELRQFSIGLDGLGPGAYRLVTILYDNRTGERFDWRDSPSQPAIMLPLAEIVIPA